jgi:hypothetical protein
LLRVSNLKPPRPQRAVAENAEMASGLREISGISTPLHFPISVALKTELQKAVLGVVALAALGTL